MADGEKFEGWCAFAYEEDCRAAPKKGIVQRFLHHSCQQFAQTVNGQPLCPRGLQRRCCPGRGGEDIFRAARDGNVGAVRHLLRTEPGSVRRTDDERPGPQSPRDCQWGLEAKPETVLKSASCNASRSSRRWIYRIRSIIYIHIYIGTGTMMIHFAP